MDSWSPTSAPCWRSLDPLESLDRSYYHAWGREETYRTDVVWEEHVGMSRCKAPATVRRKWWWNGWWFWGNKWQFFLLRSGTF